ncbi:MAG: lysophospholipase [Candidatus Brocadiae bacterium]|nr:lysophospholipase [Candidatus Brocadiia bacterium]
MEKKGTIIQAEGFFPSDKRWLYYRRFSTKVNKKGDILGIHGFLEHSGRYEELGMSLVKKGYNFYMLDLTGHGRSQGKMRTHINSIEDYLTDIANFYAFLKVHRSIETPFLFGHSMGGLLATVFSTWGKCPVKGLVLSAPFFGTKQPIPFFTLLMAKLISSVYPGFSLPGNIDPGTLSHDPEIVEDYITDPLVERRVNASAFLHVYKTMKKIQFLAPHVKVPCLIFHGESDAVNDVEASRRFFYSLGTSKKDLYIVKDAYHEVFNEKGRDQLLLKLLEWLNSENK